MEGMRGMAKAGGKALAKSTVGPGTGEAWANVITLGGREVQIQRQAATTIERLIGVNQRILNELSKAGQQRLMEMY